MTSAPMSSTLELNYHRERLTYNIDWNIPYEVGAEHHNFLMECSKLTEQSVFRSKKIFCTSGPFQGNGRYLEFFLLMNGSQAELFIKICYVETEDHNENCESFKFFNVYVYLYDRASLQITRQALTAFTYNNVDDSIPPIIELDFPKEENVCVKWAKYEGAIQSAHMITRFTFNVGVLYERWRKSSSLLEHEHLSDPSISVAGVSSKPCQLNTNDLLFSPNWSDVTIYCGDREFPAHVLILQNASSVLRAMFSLSMAENLTRKLTIEDAEPVIVEEFLRYIYTGTVTDTAKNSVGLFVIAEKYDVQRLKSLCEKFILANISVENVLERYSVGKFLNSTAITSKCIQEIRKNRKTIWKTKDEFCGDCQEFPELFYEIFYD